MSYLPGVCTFCGTGCGHYLKVDGASVNGVFPSRVHPVSKGRLCVRGWNIHELLSTHERITKPYVKDGEVSYRDAIAKLVSALSSYKPEEIAFYVSPRSSNEDNFALMKLARSVFKTNHISIQSESGHRNSLDVLFKGTGCAGMLGSLEDIRKAEVIIVAGMDITTQNPIVGSELHYAARNGSLLVTIDSRTTKIARLSKKFMNIKPGTMRQVFDAIAYYIDSEKWGKTTIAKYDEYKRYLEAVPFKTIEEVAGVSVSDIMFVAEKLAKAKSAAVFFTSGISGLQYDTVASIYNCFALADKIGREGCGVNPVAGINNLQGSFDMGCAPDLLTGFQNIDDAAAKKRFEQQWNAKLPELKGRSVEELLADSKSPLKALVIVDHDDGIIKFADRLKSLPFVAYIGAFTNKVADFAHVVLPITTYIETDGTFTNAERRVQLSVKKCNPAFDVLPMWKLVSDIAAAAGKPFNYAHASDIMDEIASLTPSYEAISHKALAKKHGIQWPCTKKNPDGAKYCATDKAAFVLPQKPYASVQANESYPYLLMLGKAQHYWHQNNIMHKTFIPLREYNATLLLYPDGYVAIAPEDAKKIGVRDRWPVKVVAEKASMKAMVMISDDVAPGTAYAPYFIRDSITSFLLAYGDVVSQGEEATIPVRIEKV
ncbi:MAG TPA: molybdopterin-dependent oxidoreductase [Spirochaetota bacterium]|nr:molybdopterin-dependent oxidoreductase [Spirochaetota bacterium]